jgi:hypothetical protein
MVVLHEHCRIGRKRTTTAATAASAASAGGVAAG